MFEIDPVKRFSAQQCLNHPWFKKSEDEFSSSSNKEALEAINQFKVRIE